MKEKEEKRKKLIQCGPCGKIFENIDDFEKHLEGSEKCMKEMGFLED